MKRSLKEICEFIGGQLRGEPSIEICGVCSIDGATAGHITFASDAKHLRLLEGCSASAAVIKEGLEAKIPHIWHGNPTLAFAKLAELFSPRKAESAGISQGAFTSPGALIGRDVTIFPFAYIGRDCEVGDGAVIYSGVYLGNGSKVGEASILHPNVVVCHGVTIGKNVVVHAGSVIGADGFGYARAEDGSHYKVPQLGGVIIGDNVEIGANVCIDRATQGNTIIEAGTKIDNLVQIGHNVRVGKNSIIVSQVGISGSCRLGENVTLAGQVGVKDHVTIGDNAIVGGRSGVTKNIAPGAVVSGFPPIPHKEWLKVQSTLAKLPQMRRAIARLAKKYLGTDVFDSE